MTHHRNLCKVCDLVGHEEPVWYVAWHPKGHLLASCSSDKSVRIWSKSAATSSWKCCAIVDGVHSRTVRSVAWSPDGRLLACASFDATVSIWRYDAAATNPDDAFEHVATLEGHEHEVKSVTWSMDGMFLASCSRDKTVWIWSRADPDDEENDEDWECVSVLSGHTQDVKRVAFSPIEHLLASASYDDTVRIWKDDGGRSDDWICEQTIQGHSSTVWDVCWDASGGKLATCSDDATVRIWERSSGWLSSAKQFRCVCTIGGIHDRPVYSVSWHPTECMLASASGDDSICIHEASSAPASAALAMDLTCRKLHAHTQDVNCVAWNPKDAALLASASDDGIVSLWSFGEQEPSPNPS